MNGSRYRLKDGAFKDDNDNPLQWGNEMTIDGVTYTLDDRGDYVSNTGEILMPSRASVGGISGLVASNTALLEKRRAGDDRRAKGASIGGDVGRLVDQFEGGATPLDNAQPIQRPSLPPQLPPRRASKRGSGTGLPGGGAAKRLSHDTSGPIQPSTSIRPPRNNGEGSGAYDSETGDVTVDENSLPEDDRDGALSDSDPFVPSSGFEGGKSGNGAGAMPMSNEDIFDPGGLIEDATKTGGGIESTSRRPGRLYQARRLGRRVKNTFDREAGKVINNVRGAFKTDHYDQLKLALDKLKEARKEAEKQANVAAKALGEANSINDGDGASKAKALNEQRAIAEQAAKNAEQAAKMANDALVKVKGAIKKGGRLLHGDINDAVKNAYNDANVANEAAEAARESADTIKGMVGTMNEDGDKAVDSVQKAESQAARAQSAELYRDRVATMMQRDAFVVASKTKNLTGALCLMNTLVLCAIFGFVTIAFAVNLRSDEYFPVLSSDVFVISGLSATFVVLRHIVREFWIGLTFLAVVTSIFSFFANLNAFQVIQNATALDAMTGTIHVNPHLNRTVVNPAAAEFPMSWWDGTKAMHVIIMGTETASAVFLLLIGMYNLYCASSISDDEGYAGSDDDEAKLQADTFQDILDESADQFGDGVGEAVSACTSFQCWDLTRCCPRRTMKSIGDSKYLLIAYMWACLLAGLMLFVYVIFALSAAVDRIPMWTAMYSPHFMLAIGIAVSIVPPVGETWWTVGADYYNRRVKAGRDVKLTLSKPQWGKRFFCGWVFLIVGVAISSAALVFQTQHVEYTTGAKWLDQLSYQQALNCTTATPELKGGYVYTCSDDQTVRRKLVEYGYGYHVIELMMLIFGGMVLVSGTMLFIVDTMNRTKVHKNLIRGPRPKKGEYLPLMIRSLEGLALLSTMDQSYLLFFEELRNALVRGDPAYWRALTPLDKRWAMDKYGAGYNKFEAQNAPSDDWTRAPGFSGGGYGGSSTLRNRGGKNGAIQWFEGGNDSDGDDSLDWDDYSDSEASTDGETRSHGSRRSHGSHVSRGSQRSRVSRRSSQSQSRRADHSPERRPRDLNINVSAKAGMEQPMAYPMQQQPPPPMMYPMQQQPPPMYTVQQPPPMPMTPRSRQNLYAYPPQDFGYDYGYGY